MILVDSNVLIDVIEKDAVWQDWSSAKIEQSSMADAVIINHIILAEAAPRSGPLDQFLNSLDAMMISIQAFSDEAAYIAGIAFQNYRKRRDKAAPSAILADFLIGGHAQVLGATILTRDSRFYKSYFPSVPIIAPSKEDYD